MTERSDLDGRLRDYLEDLSSRAGGTGMSERLAAIASTTHRVSERRRTRVITAGAGLATAAAFAAVLGLALAPRGGGAPNVGGPGGLPGVTSTATPPPPPSATPPPTPTFRATQSPTPGPSFRPTNAPKGPGTTASTWDLAVAIDEAGLRPGETVTYRVTTLFSGNTGCTNGTTAPTGGGMASGNPSGSVTLTADGSGEARGLVTIAAPAATDQGCAAGQHGEYWRVSWTSIVVSDTVNGVAETYPDQMAIAN